MVNSKGIFITFEGGEGSGKSTQVKLLADALKQKGCDVVLTREPGGTNEAEKIRDLLVQESGGDWNNMEQCLLFFAARSHLVRTVMKPALDAGKVIICDRFTDSTRAYQGYGLGMGLDVIETLHETVLDSFEPSMTILLDITAQQGLDRSTKRLQDENSGEDKYEKLDIEFHEKLRQGFLDLAKKNEDRFRVFDATQSPESLSKQIFDAVKEKL